jgi:hypothetical protein
MSEISGQFRNFVIFYSLLSTGYRGLFLPGVKVPEREAAHSSPYSAEFKNTWSYTSTPEVSLHGIALN